MVISSPHDSVEEAILPDKAMEQSEYNAPDPKRRGFLLALLGLGAIVWAAFPVGVVLRYLWPKEGEVEVLKELVLGKVSEFPPGSSKNFKFGSVPGLFIHLPNGEMHAFNAKCSHLGCTVQYQEPKNQIYCACHGGTYSPETGKNIAGPPPKPLKLLTVEVVKDSIVIKPAAATA